MRKEQPFQAKNAAQIVTILHELEQNMPPKEIAYELGIPIFSYYKIRAGQMQFPFEKIPKLAQLHAGVLELILEPLGRLSFPRAEVNGDLRGGIKDVLLSFGSLGGKLIDAVLDIVSDGHVTVDEYNLAHKLLNEHQRLSATTDEMLLRKVAI